MATAKLETTDDGTDSLRIGSLRANNVYGYQTLGVVVPNGLESYKCIPLGGNPAGSEWVVQHPNWNASYAYNAGQVVIYNGQGWVVQAGQTSTPGVAPVAGAVWGAGALAAPNPSATNGGNNRIYAQNCVTNPDGSVGMAFCATDNTTAVGSFNISATGVKTFNTDRIVLGSGAGVATIGGAGTTIAVALPQITANSVVLLTQLGPPQAVALSAVLNAGVGFTITSTPAVGAALPVAWMVAKY